MDAAAITTLFSSLQIPSNHTSVGLSNLLSSNSQVKALFHHKRLPDVGWSDLQIQRLLLELSVLDTNCEESVKCQLQTSSSLSSYLPESNNDISNNCGSFAHRWTGAGEREGRVYSPLVLQRHFGLGHGIGRSGDVMEAQPKAVGSSALLRLTLKLTLDAIRRGAGLNGTVGKGGGGPASFGVLLPVCTGMSMTLVLSGLRDRARKLDAATHNNHDDIHNTRDRNIVLWSRIDQKSCYKAILAAGLRCIVLPTKAHPDTDEVSTDLDALKASLDEHGNRILAVLTTTSCFCPRVPDEVDAVAKMIQIWNEENQIGGGAGISHVINHAYGLQCQATNKLLNRACTVGRVDAIVCSTDKNFLVPVGGALIISPDSKVIESISTTYPGRASASPMIDLFITLLSMGLDGYKRVLEDRRRLVDHFRRRLELVANVFGERILLCPRNTVSFGITLDGLIRSDVTDKTCVTHLSNENENKQITKFGSMLFTRCISGTRVVARNETKAISGHTFQGFGSSHDTYPHAYMTAACAIGMTEGEMNEFFVRLEKCWKDFFAAREKELKKKKNTQGTTDP